MPTQGGTLQKLARVEASTEQGSSENKVAAVMGEEEAAFLGE